MRINLKDSALVVVDVQEKFVPHIFEYELVLKNCGILIKGAELLGMPVTLTEQNPQKLGSTVEELKSLLPNTKVIEKIEFSCFGAEEFRNHIKDSGKKTIILCGIESHICVLQTAIDLKSAGYTPVVVWDAISSRFQLNKKLALKRLIQEGVLVTSTESVLFELMETFANPASKDISKLIK